MSRAELTFDETGLLAYFDVLERHVDSGRGQVRWKVRARRDSGKFLYLTVRLLSADGTQLTEATVAAGTVYAGREKELTCLLSAASLARAERLVVPNPDDDDEGDLLTPRPGETEDVGGLPVDVDAYRAHYRILRRFYRPTARTYYVVLTPHADRPIAQDYYDAELLSAGGMVLGAPPANVRGGLRAGERFAVRIPLGLYAASLPSTWRIVVRSKAPTGARPAPASPPIPALPPWDDRRCYPIPVEPGALRRWFVPRGFCVDLESGSIVWRLEIAALWTTRPRYEGLCIDAAGRTVERIPFALELPERPTVGDACRGALSAPKTPRDGYRVIRLA